MGKTKKNKTKKKWGKLKLKLNSQPTQYWKNKFDKDNLKTKKTCGGNTADKQKPCKGNTVAIHSVFFFLKKATKISSQPAQYKKKNW